MSVISWLVWPEGVGGSWRGRGREKAERGEQLWLLLQHHSALQSAGSCCCLLGSPSFSHLLPFQPHNPLSLLHSPLSFFTDPSSQVSAFSSLSLSLSPHSQTLGYLLPFYMSPSLHLPLTLQHPIDSSYSVYLPGPSEPQVSSFFCWSAFSFGYLRTLSHFFLLSVGCSMIQKGQGQNVSS